MAAPGLPSPPGLRLRPGSRLLGRPLATPSGPRSCPAPVPSAATTPHSQQALSHAPAPRRAGGQGQLVGGAQASQTSRGCTGTREPTLNPSLCCSTWRPELGWAGGGRTQVVVTGFFRLRFPLPDATGPEPGDPGALSSREAGAQSPPVALSAAGLTPFGGRIRPPTKDRDPTASQHQPSGVPSLPV